MRPSTWRDRKRDGSLPLGGGGLAPLAPQGAQRPRRLGHKGEGVTAVAGTPTKVVLERRATPSPCFSRLAPLAKRNSPPPPRGRGCVPSDVVRSHASTIAGSPCA